MRAIFRNRQAVQALSGEVAMAIDELVSANNVQPLEVGDAKIRSGPGSPEGRIVGNPGDLYLRTDGASGAVTYYKETGKNTSTGWAAGSGGSGSGSGGGGTGPMPGLHHETHETGGTDPITALDGVVITTGTVSDARLSGNVAFKNTPNTFTALNQFNYGSVEINGTAPGLYLTDLSGSLDHKRFRLITSGGALGLEPLNDAVSVVYPSVRIDHAGRVNLESGQLQFPLTANPSIEPTILDDYREGFWVPVDRSGAGLTLTYGSCYYIKVGRLVHFYATVTYPSNASGNGVFVGGLPFLCSAIPGVATFSSTPVLNVAPPFLGVPANDNYVEFTKNTGGRFTNAEFTGATLFFGGHYISVT